ncbi:unnamed protein product [Owenia fusiformis]|uniref:Uncharacterized protein n=1 Tax=Owenia fusiformis TaxID=6347 RepID=A0A8J1TF10_OWEFU|nr:unnamed protein product [Owenia fusiformis]
MKTITLMSSLTPSMKTGWILLLIFWRTPTSIGEIYNYHDNIIIDLISATFAQSIQMCAIHCAMKSNQCTCFHYNSLNECYLLNTAGRLPQSRGSTGHALYCSSDASIGGAYLGCFADVYWDRDLHKLTATVGALTPQACIDACRNLDQGYLYAGLQNGGGCHCGTNYGKYGPSTSCDKACPGDSTQICGGYNANNIYAV